MGLRHKKYIDYIKGVHYYYAVHQYQRLGQAYYNFLRLSWPHLENEIRNTEFDCFNNDDRLSAFLTWVQARLDRLDDNQ